MVKKLVLGAVLGGLAAYLWGTVSWMALPWHNATMKRFTNEVAVANIVRSNASGSGVYLLQPHHWKNPTTEQSRIPKEFMFFGVVRHGAPPMTIYYLRGLAVMMLGALFVAWVLLVVPPMDYAGRVRLAALLGFGAGVLARLPDWNWWSYSPGFTATAIADLTITWLLAGLVIAKVVTPPTPRGKKA